MTDRTFTVVIPTRNRADVLRATLASAISQTDPRVQILVSDNASTDDTRAVVDSLVDERVRYVNPGKYLGMTEHWEFALSHVGPGFFTVLGDDDGLLPDAVARARQLLKQSGCRALAWRKAEYHWPDHIVPSYRNWLQIPFGDVVELEAIATLRDVLAFRRTYTDLPCVYNSFVATEILTEIRYRSGGRLLPCVTPDIYSGIAVACTIERYAFSGSPLSVNAASRHSNGTLSSFRGINIASTAEHLKATNQRIHPRLVASSSVPVLIADAALIARDHLSPAAGWPEIDWRAMLDLALRSAEFRPASVFAETLAALEEIALRNNLMDVWLPIKSTANQKDLPRLQTPGWDDARAHLAIDGAALDLRDVSDAALFTAAVVGTITLKESGGAVRSCEQLSAVMRNLDADQCAVWKRFLFELERPPPAKSATALERYWLGIRSRARRLLNCLQVGSRS